MRVCQHAAGGLLYTPVIILLRALFIAAIIIMPWSFKEDFTSVLHHSLELLKIFVLGGGHVGNESDFCSCRERAKLGAKFDSKK